MFDDQPAARTRATDNCSHVNCTCSSEEETTSASRRAEDVCEIHGGHHNWRLESSGAAMKWSIAAAHDNLQIAIPQEAACEQWLPAVRDFSGRTSATV